MRNLAGADDVLHSALYFVELVGMAGQSLQSDARGPIMRGTEAAAEEIRKAIALIDTAERGGARG
ncbi:MAG: hypothetical protein WBA88_14495 [Pseudaminobacter sp.]